MKVRLSGYSVAIYVIVFVPSIFWANDSKFVAEQGGGMSLPPRIASNRVDIDGYSYRLHPVGTSVELSYGAINGVRASVADKWFRLPPEHQVSQLVLARWMARSLVGVVITGSSTERNCYVITISEPPSSKRQDMKAMHRMVCHPAPAQTILAVNADYRGDSIRIFLGDEVVEDEGRTIKSGVLLIEDCPWPATGSAITDLHGVMRDAPKESE